MTPPLTDAEIARRLSVWVALADLFLDTDVMLCVPHIARRIIESGYSLDAVEAMLRWEVRPAFYRNLLSVAGEWAGWPEDYVREMVLARGHGSWFDRLLIGRDRFFPREEWAAIVAAVQAASATPLVSAIQPPPRTRSPA